MRIQNKIVPAPAMLHISRHGCVQCIRRVTMHWSSEAEAGSLRWEHDLELKLRWPAADFDIRFKGEDFVEIDLDNGFESLCGEQFKMLFSYIRERRSCERRRFADPTCRECVAKEQHQFLLHPS